MPLTLPIAFATALAVALTVSLAQPAEARRVRPPPVPADLEVEAGSRAFLVGHAVGTQNYICLPSGTKIAWALFAPEATLFDDHGRQLTTHFFSPNPSEADSFRPTWQHSRDTSAVWAKLDTPSSDPAYVAPGAIPWLLLEVVGAVAGPYGRDTLGSTTQIHRVNTAGGVAPSTGCSTPEEIGNKAIVPYTADYIFYSHPGSDAEERR
jgi:hypothetical protein